MKALRILLLSPWMPWPPHDGGRIRVLSTVRYLCQRHHVTLVAPSRSPRDAHAMNELRQVGAQVATAALPGGWRALAGRALLGALRGRPLVASVHHGHALAAQVRRLAAGGAFDIVQVEFSWFTPYLEALPRDSRSRTVLTLHNVESLRFARELRSATTLARRLALEWDRRVAGDWEPRAVRAVDAVAVVSEAERRWVEHVAPGTPVALAPNGVDTEHFQPGPAPARGPLVFTGAMDYPPNVDALLWFCSEVWPALRQKTPLLRLDVVGRSPAARIRALHGQDGIRVTGEVADVRVYLGRASVVIVPLRAGAGTRLKILEALAMGRPVVSTTLGAEGLEVSAGTDLLLADTAEKFTRAVEHVLASPRTARRLGEAGRRLAVARYDWRRALRPLEDLYERLLQTERAVAATGAR